MKSRAVRVTLFVVFLAAVGTAAYLFWIADSKTHAEGGAARSFDAIAHSAAAAVADLRLAQQGYVAAGQGDQFWSVRADQAATRAREQLSKLQNEATSPAARTEIDSAIETLKDFVQMDRRARDYARSAQKLLASDLVFSDGLQLTQSLSISVEQARLAELDAREAVAATIHRRQLYALGAAAAAATLVVLLLVPAGAPRGQVAPAVAVPAPPVPRPRQDEALDLTLALDDDSEGWSAPRRVEMPSDPPVPVNETAGADTKVESPPAEAERTPPPVDIGGVASLCTELACISDTRAIPAAIERAATVLDAAGIILWIADPDGRELAPIVTHGYPPQLVTRLGTIGRDTENATAAAFRTSLLQTVNADWGSNGAIAAPLLTPGGCVGVMAAEVRGGGERQEARLAAATIVAAQLATLVGPPSTRAHDRSAEAAGA